MWGTRRTQGSGDGRTLPVLRSFEGIVRLVKSDLVLRLILLSNCVMAIDIVWPCSNEDVDVFCSSLLKFLHWMFCAFLMEYENHHSDRVLIKIMIDYL
ncbi:hypothetical protein NPIL_440121 [Nephila pilipes]|uniref:Uncharacterized protein n=1 Tax=Nephila pilipes TaxID=299642 RepID=A0A8X6QUJ2_NEPPI|nr:hypothetical protein NPIL_440121 [Nephila pilipes]